jgi:acetoin utilization deacetylase AcuC-like enzyme
LKKYSFFLKKYSFHQIIFFLLLSLRFFKSSQSNLLNQICSQMKLLYHPIFLEHDTGNHPENKNRLLAFGDVPITAIMSGEPFLPLIHDEEYIQLIKAASLAGIALDGDTITSKRSYEAAVFAAGAAIQASQTGNFALVRPPGHHAYPNEATGFCLFNNIAVATQILLNQGKRVMILDFDGHLGDGTAHIFYNEPNVLFCSLHQYPAFPGNGFVNEIGDDAGKGYTINIPLPPMTGDDIAMNAMQTVLLVAQQFKPDVVAVSAGFDAHHSDPLLDLRWTYNTYYKIGKMLRLHFSNIFAVLEGGYNVETLPKCCHSFLAGINGEKIPFKEPETESSMNYWREFEMREGILLQNLAPYWRF